MELLMTPTSSYLLQASLDVLHYESREWQNEIVFALDEVMFLHKLHRQFSEKDTPVTLRKQTIRLQEELRSLSGKLLNMQETIREHEKYLAKIIQNKINESDDEYRAAHKKVKLQTESLLKELRDLKTQVFQWTENILS